MKKWEAGAIIGAIWGFLSIFLLLAAIPPHNLVKWVFGSPLAIAFIPAGIAFLIMSLFNLVFSLYSFHYLSLFFVFTLSIISGTLIGAIVGYLIDKYTR